MFTNINNLLIQNRQTFCIVKCEIHGENTGLLNKKCKKCYEEEYMKSILKNQQEMLLRFKQDAGIPMRYQHSTFENYVPENLKSDQMLELCKSYKADKNLLMLGKTGTGKTHLACAIIDQMLRIKSNANVQYVKFYDLSEIKVKNNALYQKILYCKLLIIDEYGHSTTDFKTSLMTELIDKRYDALGFTVIISNLVLKDFKSYISPQLNSRLGQDIQVQNFDWEDYRLRNK